MTVREATKLAEQFLRDAFGPDTVSNIRLEELDVTQEGRWLVTLSFARKDISLPFGQTMGTLAALNIAPRDMKIFTVDEGRGGVVSMKNREK